MPPPAEGLASRLFLIPALRTQPDRRLVALVREGYESAFEEIVRRYGKPLGRYAASIVGGRSEDVLQDAFAKALPALCRDDAEIDLRPWLFRIVRNTALNELRDNPPSPELLAAALAGGSDPSEELERREQLADLIRRLQALPERQRAAIVMRELEGLGHAEIAAALGLSGGAARQAIHRARQALREGAGMLVPLPLLKALLESAGPASGEAAAGIGAAGAGAGVALKATTATVLVAGALGAGVALRHESRGSEAAASPPAPVTRAADRARLLVERPRPAGDTAGETSGGGGAAEGGGPRPSGGAGNGPSAGGDGHPGSGRREAGSEPGGRSTGASQGGGGSGGDRSQPGDRSGSKESGRRDGGSLGAGGDSGGGGRESSIGEESEGSSSGEDPSSGDSGSGEASDSGGEAPESGDGGGSGSHEGSSGGEGGALEETSGSGSEPGNARDSGEGGGFSLPTDP